jgi:short-subunit dehydrogenase
MDFKNKVVIITGASSGIGKALAEELAKRGANLVLGARQYVTLCEITAELEKNYQIKALAVQADVSKEEDCAELVKQAINTFGKIDILINNAGLSMRALFKDLDLSVLKNLMDVNFWGTIYCTKYALPEILKTKGSIVGVSSIAGYRGLNGLFIFKICNEWFHGIVAHRIIKNRSTCNGCLPRLYNFKYSRCGFGKRWSSTWRNEYGRR